MSFDKLLEELNELETLQKAEPVEGAEDDEKIQAAAEDGDPDMDGDDANDVTGDEIVEDADEVEEEDEPMGKSFTMKLDDGTEVEAVDGTALVKSLMARVENSEGQMVKAMESAVGLIKSQGDMIKSLQSRVSKLSDSGRGRKTVVSINEKKTASDLRKSQEEEEGITGQQFMAKAMSAQAAGKITGVDVARIESYLNRGLQLPADIVARVTE